ncbi:MAG: SUF system Fe-S cluster assembly regulator [Gemmatimonadetes bacterium]|nr:SUF system Fe-S cluster assembly regulator [Gemmatimonadota bacterium]
MLRISKITDYGIVALTTMGRHEADLPLTARDVSEGSGLPLPTVSKILKTLTRAGILVSHRGTKGGYTLSRVAGDISVAEVITALEGPISVTECTDHGHAGECDHESGCPVRGHWQVINRAIVGALQGITVAEMMLTEPVQITADRDAPVPEFVSIEEER